MLRRAKIVVVAAKTPLEDDPEADNGVPGGFPPPLGDALHAVERQIHSMLALRSGPR
jgi:hypothetical protein